MNKAGNHYPITRPALPPKSDFIKKLDKIWESGQITSGYYVQAFEEEVKDLLGVGHTVAVSSCTSGLILTFRALQLTGEVIVPTFTFSATVHALIWNGIKPIFCDSEPGTLCMDPDLIEGLITEKTSGIVPVSVFGASPSATRFEGLAEKYNLKLVFDSAQALGAMHGNKYVGGFGDAEIFSLSPTKVITAVEGGLVTTDSDEIADRVRRMRDYGKAEGGEDMDFVGLSARMCEPNAIMGMLNLQRMKELVEKRKELVARYRECLDGLHGIKFQKIPPGVSSTFNFMVIFVQEEDGMSRDILREKLVAYGIHTKRYFYPPVHELSVYRKQGAKYKDRLPVAERAAREALALPLYHDLSLDDVEYISSRIRSILLR